jgi:hypothetical protein
VEADDNACVVEDDRYPLLPPGRYRVLFDHWQTIMLFARAPKLALWFVISEPGEAFGKRIAKFYNVSRVVGRPGRNGRFRVGKRSHLVKDFYRLLPDRVQRLDRLPISAFGQSELVAEVRTVESDFQQSKLPQALTYSVINKLDSS